MKKINFTTNENLTSHSSNRYNYSETERNQHISEINEVVKTDARLNEIKEAKSFECASKFVTTSI
jgi:hypothetical protein